MRQLAKMRLEPGDRVRRAGDGRVWVVGVENATQLKPRTVEAMRPIDADGTPCGPWAFRIGQEWCFLVGTVKPPMPDDGGNRD